LLQIQNMACHESIM